MTGKRNLALNKILKLALIFALTITTISVTQLTGHAAFSFTAVPTVPNADTQISLSWSSVAGAACYKISRAMSGDELQAIKTVDIDSEKDYLNYTDKGLNPETEYIYEICAYSDKLAANELASDSVSVSTSTMLAPTILSATYDINTKLISLTWKNNSLVVAGSIVRISGDSNDLTAVSGTLQTCSFPDPNLGDNSEQSYTVLSVDDPSLGHTSEESPPVTITPVDPPVVTVSVTNGAYQISWDSSEQITNFNLERSKYTGTTWGSWQAVNSQIPARALNVNDTPSTGGTYRYRLAAKNCYTGYSNITDTVTRPMAPSGLSGIMASTNTFNLSWTINSSNDCSLRVERAVDSGSFTPIATLDKSATSYTDTCSSIANIIYYRIVAYESVNNKSISNVCQISTTKPTSPSSLSLAVLSSSQVILNWVDNSNNETSFKIERKTDSGSFAEIASAPANSITYTDGTSTPLSSSHTYTYRVRASNPIGYSASYTNEVYCTTTAVAQPSSLDLTPTSETTIDLKWTYPQSQSYTTYIERNISGKWTLIADLPGGTTKYTDTGLTTNTQYFYRIKAVSDTVTSSTYPNDNNGKGVYTLLKIPYYLDGSAVTTSKIHLTWDSDYSNTQFVIERKTGSADFAAVATVGANVFSWDDTTGLVANSKYIYRIKAKTASNSSLYSDEATVICTALSSPSGLGVIINSATSAQLTWNDNSDNETGFEIWRKVTSTGAWSKYAAVGRNVKTYTDSSLSSNTQYYYRVRAYITQYSIYSSYTGDASIKTILLNPPSGVQGEIISNSQAVITWTDNSDTENGYKVERKTGKNGQWAQLASLLPNVTSYTSKDLVPGTEYFYRINVYNTSNKISLYSDEAKVITGTPSAPSDLTAEVFSATCIKLAWEDNSNNEDGFTIERKKFGEDSYSELTKTDPNTTSYSDEDLDSGSQYYYRIKAFNSSGETPYTKVASAITSILVTFNDIDNYPWAQEAIENLASRKIINGKSNSQFAPGDTMTRAEFVCLMMRAFKLSKASVGNLTDVSPSQWFYKDIMSAKALGIISTDDNNCYYPDTPIAREDMAVIITKTLKAVEKSLPSYDPSTLDSFLDKNQISSYALSSMASLVGEGLMNGKSDTSIAPKDSTTRAEAAVMMYETLSR